MRFSMSKPETVPTYIEVSHDIATGDIIFNGRVVSSDMVRTRFDRIDRACLSTKVETAADIMQNLEIIFRRIGEQHGK